MKDTTTLGNLGEGIACRFLESRGLSVIERNYRKKWGEIDIIAKKGEKLHFVEVKSVVGAVGGRMPEENVHEKKLKRLFRTIQTYLASGKEEPEWQLDVLAVFLDMEKKEARVRLTENVLLD